MYPIFGIVLAARVLRSHDFSLAPPLHTKWNVSRTEPRLGREVCSIMDCEGKYCWTKGTKMEIETVLPASVHGQGHVLSAIKSKKYSTKPGHGDFQWGLTESERSI